MEFLTALAGGWAIVWTLLLFGILTATVENELGIASFVVLAVGVLALELTGTTTVSFWVLENPARTVFLAGLYLLAGAAWALFKWWLYVRRQREKIASSYKYWSGLRANEGKPFDAFIDSSDNPVALGSENRSRIILWMMWWVPSMFWTITADLVIGIWNRVYDMLGGGFAKIARHVVSKTIGQ